MRKPGRPLGLSLAIVTAVMLFSILPLVQVLFFVSLKHRFQDIEFLEGGGASGVDVIGVSDTALLIQTVVAVVFLVIAIYAWQGKPVLIRYVFMVAVVLLTGATVIATAIALTGIRGVEALFDPLATLSNSLVQARLVFTVLVALYVLWYVNRGPARAFYRGYYLDKSENG
jgi:hypothetical protein